MSFTSLYNHTNFNKSLSIALSANFSLLLLIVVFILKGFPIEKAFLYVLCGMWEVLIAILDFLPFLCHVCFFWVYVRGKKNGILLSKQNWITTHSPTTQENTLKLAKIWPTFVKFAPVSHDRKFSNAPFLIHSHMSRFSQIVASKSCKNLYCL